jgi:hypothetical protein
MMYKTLDLTYAYEITKEKLPVTNAAIWFKKKCVAIEPAISEI